MHGNFYIDGISSESIGLQIVSLQGENNAMPIFGGQSVVEQDAIGRDYTAFVKTKKNNLKFDLVFSLIDGCGVSGSGLGGGFTKEKLYEIGRFLLKSKPVEFKLAEDTAKVLYVVPVSGVEVIRFGELKGYFTVSFQASTPYWLTAPEILIYNLSANGTFSVENKSNIQNSSGAYDVFPHLKIEPQSGSVFTLTDLSDARRITFTELGNGEFIEMQNKQVFASISGNILSKWNKEVFVLHEGVNTFRVNADCRITVNLQYPIT